MDDASGHYTTGFYWGNNYWTGSRTLCRSIYRVDDDYFQEKKVSANTGLTFNPEQDRQATHLVHVNPPFFPRFGVVKVGLRESTLVPSVSDDFCHISTGFIVDHIYSYSYLFQPRTIFIGVCLPTTCDKEDVFIIAESAGRKFETKAVEIKDVRIPNSDGFSLWTDGTFIIML